MVKSVTSDTSSNALSPRSLDGSSQGKEQSTTESDSQTFAALQRQQIIQLHKHLPQLANSPNKQNRASRYLKGQSLDKLQQQQQQQQPEQRGRRRSKSDSRSKQRRNGRHQQHEGHQKKSEYRKRIAEDFGVKPFEMNQNQAEHLNQHQGATTNVYILDKYAAKYSAHQLEFALTKSKCFGQEVIIAFWLLSIYALIFLDFLKYNLYLMQGSTYNISRSADMGLIPSTSDATYGWPILLIIFFALTYAIYFLLSFKSVVITSSVLAIVVFSEVLIMTLCASSGKIIGGNNMKIYRNNSMIKGNRERGFANLIILILISVVWLTYHLVSIYYLLSSIRVVTNEEEYPQDYGVLIKKKSVQEEGAEPKAQVQPSVLVQVQPAVPQIILPTQYLSPPSPVALQQPAAATTIVASGLPPPAPYRQRPPSPSFERAAVPAPAVIEEEPMTPHAALPTVEPPPPFPLTPSLAYQPPATHRHQHSRDPMRTHGHGERNPTIVTRRSHQRKTSRALAKVNSRDSSLVTDATRASGQPKAAGQKISSRRKRSNNSDKSNSKKKKQAVKKKIK